MKKLAIIGASYLQLPLILKAKDLGLETHVFAWAAGDVGEEAADHFYPISITEKDLILEECRKIGISGICSIASDLAVLTVNYVAENMGLTGNGIDSSLVSVNKHDMKIMFMSYDVPCAKGVCVSEGEKPDLTGMDYPLIVKPTDRSGSRGITRIDTKKDDIKGAIARACSQSFEKKAMIEEFIPGDEYSVECISFEGEHTLLAVTQKYTTGSPNYIETGHLQPAAVDGPLKDRIKDIVFAGLDSLGIMYGASHAEIKISGSDIKVIEIGARMGGDMIGSTLVRLSTGYDMVKAVIDIALGEKPEEFDPGYSRTAAIRYLTDEKSMEDLRAIEQDHPEIIYEADGRSAAQEDVIDSSSRKGYYIIVSDQRDIIERFMPGSRA